jgi:hypothetical protein
MSMLVNDLAVAVVVGEIVMVTFSRQIEERDGWTDP